MGQLTLVRTAAAVGLTVETAACGAHLLLLLHLGHNPLGPDGGAEVADSSVSGEREDEDGLDGFVLLVVIEESGDH